MFENRLGRGSTVDRLMARVTAPHGGPTAIAKYEVLEHDKTGQNPKLNYQHIHQTTTTPIPNS
ncbi:hypothetical protein PGT21_002900 [Puccinia graminis f. sp. tritici]|uniref:Uncharacterized protein n=1 Tax=Puccinia graminis f. sp. tritici TaxID=56615 RepID=A0A5B0QWN7_PUCGR|nr:hypothetical protein PGT21_002900 [Puccinia graminis f. sp. tritici]